MRIVHFADGHLGASRYGKTTRDGQNQRQHDVQVAFCRMMDGIIAAKPDMVLVGGDLFEMSRPNNRTIEVAMQEFGRLKKALPSCEVVVVAGNHDTPRADENGHVFGILGTLPIHVVDRGIERLPFGDLSVLCVPDTPAAQREIKDLKTRGLTIGQLGDEKAARNVLLMHGEVEGMLPKFSNAPAPRSEIERPLEELAPERWAYTALGHWHVYREMAPRTFYSGSLEYTSTDPWSELRQEAALGVPGKGFIVHDLETGAHEFHPVACERRHIDLPTFSAEGLSVAEVNAAIAERVGAEAIDNQVVRLVVTEVSKSLMKELDQTALRKYKLRALNFNLVTKAPAPVTHVSTANTAAARRNAGMFMQVLAERVARYELEAGLDRARFNAIASDILEQVKPDEENGPSLLALLEASIAAGEAKAA